MAKITRQRIYLSAIAAGVVPFLIEIYLTACATL